ncbi:MAG: hypothetical protein ACYCT2_07355 [Thermoplasmataceae archaeon]
MAVTWEGHIINSPFPEISSPGYVICGSKENIAHRHCVTKIIIS